MARDLNELHFAQNMKFSFRLSNFSRFIIIIIITKK